MELAITKCNHLEGLFSFQPLTQHQLVKEDSFAPLLTVLRLSQQQLQQTFVELSRHTGNSQLTTTVSLPITVIGCNDRKMSHQCDQPDFMTFVVAIK